MKIAVISDIHGNDLAFEAVAADIAATGVDAIVCCGDTVQGGVQPHEVVQRLQELNCLVVMGNADDLTLHGKATTNIEPPNAWIDAVRAWQLPKLTQDDLAYIAAFPATVEVALPNGKRLLAAHGSPKHFNDEIHPGVPDEKVWELLEPNDETIFCGGHTHLQHIRQLGENFFFNPGSVSLPNRRDLHRWVFHLSNRWAEYAVLTAEANGREALELRRVPYDVEKLIAMIDASDMPNAYRLSDFYRAA